jgi:hypothetical protein
MDLQSNGILVGQQKQIVKPACQQAGGKIAKPACR